MSVHRAAGDASRHPSGSAAARLSRRPRPAARARKEGPPASGAITRRVRSLPFGQRPQKSRGPRATGESQRQGGGAAEHAREAIPVAARVRSSRRGGRFPTPIGKRRRPHQPKAKARGKGQEGGTSCVWGNHQTRPLPSVLPATTESRGPRATGESERQGGGAAEHAREAIPVAARVRSARRGGRFPTPIGKRRRSPQPKAKARGRGKGAF